ncbi:uncharacterized protein LOC120635334 [Pararge aegeria]|uniref:uncharacterized protein LOC120635334 n=1 Tax=Pararge aegeria TaxID=116150 RepID=UPI0019CF6D07|nr:uncharacterized protein LOC120635334 [Pararge aegeria]
MAKRTVDVGTLTLNNELQRIKETYKKCELLHVIQHVDIYGRIRSSYTENTTKAVNDSPITVTSVSCSSPRCTARFTKPGLEEKLSKFSMTTKLSGLYPGNDILSKRIQTGKLKQMTTKNNVVFGSVLSR